MKNNPYWIALKCHDTNLFFFHIYIYGDYDLVKWKIKNWIVSDLIYVTHESLTSSSIIIHVFNVLSSMRKSWDHDIRPVKTFFDYTTFAYTNPSDTGLYNFYFFCNVLHFIDEIIAFNQHFTVLPKIIYKENIYNVHLMFYFIFW